MEMLFLFGCLGLFIRVFDRPINISKSVLKEIAHYLKKPTRFINAFKLTREDFKDYDLLEIAKEYQYAKSDVVS